MDCQKTQGESSDDDLSKPAPIPSQLFHHGPLTLKAYHEACECTPAQPRSYRSSSPKAPMQDGEQCVKTLRLPEARPIESCTFRLDNIFEISASQSADSDIDRSSASSSEPDRVKKGSRANDSTRDHDEPMVQKNDHPDRQPTKEPKTSNGSLAYLFGEKRAKKQFTVKPSLPSRTSLDESDQENTFQHRQLRKTARKKRRLPQCNELVMVPFLGDDFRENLPESGAHQETDPIEETQASYPITINRITLPQVRRRPLWSIQKKIRPQQNEYPSLQAFNFRALKNTAPSATRCPAINYTAREGFEDHEMKLPPKVSRKRPSPRCIGISLPCLPLAHVRDLKRLPLAPSTLDNHHEDDPTGPIAFYQPFDDQATKGRLEFQEYDSESTVRQRTMSLHAQEFLADSHTSQPLKPPRSSRRVSFSEDIRSQLTGITAPTREPSDNEEESESESSSSEDAESELEHAISVEEEFDAMSYNSVDTQNGYRSAIDEIEDDGLLLESLKNNTDTKDVLLEAHPGPDHPRTRPGQLEKMKSSGRLIEVLEDVIEVQSSNEASNAITGYMAPYRSSVIEPPWHAVTRMPKQLKSILKNPSRAEDAPTHIERKSIKSLSTLMFDHHHWANVDIAIDTQIQIDAETITYFSQAQSQLSCPVRRHSIILRRRTQQISHELDSAEDDFTKGNEPLRISEYSPYFSEACGMPCVGAAIRTIFQGPRSPRPSLRTLVRRTSQEFGTTSTRLRRTPSLPFNPPFLKNSSRS